VSDELPFAPPFRERGMVLPTRLPEHLGLEVLPALLADLADLEGRSAEYETY
jgi:hypothetical protein